MVAYALVETQCSYLALAEESSLDWRAYHSRVQVLVRGRGAPDAEEARLLREGQRIEIWRKVGEPNMVAYVERYFGYGRRCAYDRLRVANALGELPLVEKAVASGELFYATVRELTRVAIWETEEAWLKKAMGKSVHEVQTMVSGRKKGDGPEAPPKPENIRHVLTHEVSAEADALLREARKVLQDELGERLDDSAFLSILARSVLDGSEKGSKHRIAVTKCDECKRAWQDGGGAVMDLPKETLERIECDAERMDAQGKVSRHIPEAMRRRVLARDHHRCRVPWCHSAHNLEPHHIEHFARGGKTEDDNLITLCWHHHTKIHERTLRLRMENREATFERVEPVPFPANETHPPSMTETAIRALVGMGFKKPEAQSFVETATAHGGKSMTLNELVREALKRSPKLRG